MEQLFTDIESWAAQECGSQRKGNRTMRGNIWTVTPEGHPSREKVNRKRIESRKAKAAGIHRTELHRERRYEEKQF